MELLKGMLVKQKQEVVKL